MSIGGPGDRQPSQGQMREWLINASQAARFPWIDATSVIFPGDVRFDQSSQVWEITTDSEAVTEIAPFLTDPDRLRRSTFSQRTGAGDQPAESPREFIIRVLQDVKELVDPAQREAIDIEAARDVVATGAGGGTAPPDEEALEGVEVGDITDMLSNIQERMDRIEQQLERLNRSQGGNQMSEAASQLLAFINDRPNLQGLLRRILELDREGGEGATFSKQDIPITDNDSNLAELFDLLVANQVVEKVDNNEFRLNIPQQDVQDALLEFESRRFR